MGMVCVSRGAAEVTAQLLPMREHGDNYEAPFVLCVARTSTPRAATAAASR